MEIKSLDDKSERTHLLEEEWRRRYQLESELQEIYIAEEIYWQKRGGERWILQGDSNTSFFHKCANGRKRKPTITSLEDGERIISDLEELKTYITTFYKKLFGEEETANIHLTEEIRSHQEKVSTTENERLTQEFTLEEVDAALKQIKNGTAPGPDGLSIEFFKHFWSQLRLLIHAMLCDLHNGSLDLWRLNYGVIVLIPKLKLPNNIKQFRPICLLNLVYKIITKVLTLRLTEVVDRVISKNQTAFITWRSILDGVVILQEVVHELKRTKQEGIILKLDFEKAYDRVSWHFLEEVLTKKGFSQKWVSWMMKAVKGGRVAIDVNGERGVIFRSYKGLRQGDPYLLCSLI